MSNQLLSLKDLADETGISIGTFRTWMHKKTFPFPHVRLGKKYYIPRDAIDTYIKSELKGGK